MATIEILDSIEDIPYMVYALKIRHHTRVWLGCSVLDQVGREKGQGIYPVSAPATVVCKIKIPDSCAKEETRAGKPLTYDGNIIFALWSDDTFTERLASTGWRDFFLDRAISSMHFKLKEQFENKYGTHPVWQTG